MGELILKEAEFQKFSKYVHAVCGINLHDGKKELLKARLGKLVRQRNIGSFDRYYDLVVQDTSGLELIQLLDSISTNLTSFFREPAHFHFLKTTVLPEIIDRRKDATPGELRFWSAGCSSGEEAYSIAVAVSEALNSAWRTRVKILATDLSTKVLQIAASGVYNQDKAKNIPYELKRRYFQKGENRWRGYLRVKKELREMIRFQRLNFMDEFRFARLFDVIFCRNVMIYFDNSTKQQVVAKFCRCLAQGGYLFIGHSESLTGVDHTLRYVQPSIFKKL